MSIVFFLVYLCTLMFQKFHPRIYNKITLPSKIYSGLYMPLTSAVYNYNCPLCHCTEDTVTMKAIRHYPPKRELR